MIDKELVGDTVDESVALIDLLTEGEVVDVPEMNAEFELEAEFEGVIDTVEDNVPPCIDALSKGVSLGDPVTEREIRGEIDIFGDADIDIVAVTEAETINDNEVRDDCEGLDDTEIVDLGVTDLSEEIEIDGLGEDDREDISV